MTRHDGRTPDELRELDLQPDFLEQPHGSVLYAQGRTVVLCTATVEQDIPRWLRGKGKGWMTAEYSLLPASTGERTQRAVSRGRPDGRTVEIQRLIGRALRSVCDFEALGERTLWLDCDVLQADGGTRCAAITGAYVAAFRALDRFGLTKALPSSVAAVSVGVVDGEPVLDLDYVEDSSAETDMNVVMAADGRLVEVQATAEREPFSRELLDRLLDLATGGIEKLADGAGSRLRGSVAPVVPRLVLASGNTHKLEELRRALLGFDVRAARPRRPAARGRGDVRRQRASSRRAGARTYAPEDAWVVGEDSGIEAAALDGAPGVRTARWAAGDPVGRMLEALRARTSAARATSASSSRSRCDGREVVADGHARGAHRERGVRERRLRVRPGVRPGGRDRNRRRAR